MWVQCTCLAGQLNKKKWKWKLIYFKTHHHQQPEVRRDYQPTGIGFWKGQATRRDIPNNFWWTEDQFTIFVQILPWQSTTKRYPVLSWDQVRTAKQIRLQTTWEKINEPNVQVLDSPEERCRNQPHEIQYNPYVQIYNIHHEWWKSRPLSHIF